MIRQFFMKPAFVFIVILSFSLTAQAQEKSEDQPVRLTEYAFNATTFTCQSASMRALTPGEFSVKITPDSVIVDLPYYGKYYAGSQTASGIRFTSARFDRTTTEKKKGKLFLTI